MRVIDTRRVNDRSACHIDPADDGAEIVNAVGDRIRTELYRRNGLDDLLRPSDH